MDFSYYKAYGLVIQSPIPLTEFVSTLPAEPDVVVNYGLTPHWSTHVREKKDHLEIHGDEAHFWFLDTAAFTVVGGREIIVSPAREAEESLLRLYIQGMMMAMILHQRGSCVLHASVVQIGDVAVAFLGQIGAGKSSTTAALCARGYTLVADDNAAIQLDSIGPKVVPAYPHLKLFPAIATELGFAGDSLKDLHSSQRKQAAVIEPAQFAILPLPLHHLYILRRGCKRSLVRLSALETLSELICHSVPTRWGHPGDERQLRRCSAIAERVPAYNLETFSDLSSLSAFVDAIKNDCEAKVESISKCRLTRSSPRDGEAVEYQATANTH